MGRHKKQHLAQRSDGRYRCMYKGLLFYGNTEDEALQAREDYKEAEKTGIWSIPTVSEYALKWLPVARPTVTKSTYRGLAIHLEHLVQEIGDIPINEVTPFQIKEVYSAHYAGLSNSYILAAKQLYIDMFDAAVSEGLIRINPARDKTALPHKGKKGGHRSITDQERTWIETLCLDHPCHAAAMTMLYAGVRPQEVKAMTIEGSVDFQAGVIRLSEFAHLDGFYEYEITSEGKTDKAAREIPLLSILRKTLEGRTGFIMKDRSGERVTVDTWQALWASYQSAIEQAVNGTQKRWYGQKREHKAIIDSGGKLPPWREFDVVPYDLRHSFCTMCRDNGVELHTCIEWMGHADAKMIMKIYDEVSDQRSKIEAQKLEKALQKGQNLGQKKKVYRLKRIK